MRWVNRLITLAAVVSISAVAAMAQGAECTDEFKTATYSKWYDNRADHQDVAYEAAVEYFKVCTNPPADDPYAKALRTFKEKYEALKANQSVATQFENAVKTNNYAETMRLGKQIVAGTPDNSLVYIFMANTGLGDPNLLTESGQAAKKAIELIEAGKTFSPAYKTKDQALAALTYIIAKATAKTSAVDSIPFFIKTVRYDSDLKKDARVYNELAAAHGERVAKLTADYQPFIGKPETNESKLILANLNQAIDLQIDALARATALADAANKPALMDRLAELYKFRNKSDTGLNELLAGVLGKPVPDIPKPITELPTPVPSPTPTTPASGPGGSNTTGGAAPGGSSTNGSNSRSLGPVNTGAAKTTTTTTTSAPPATAKPSATPKPKPRSNHRGH
ncbi:MAG TPA: hypothetical protein VIU65_11860 [Pyrinomonadaceae bacterium]